MSSLNHLYVGGGEPSPSWQVRVAVLPVVTEEGTLHNGGDGGTAGQHNQVRETRSAHESTHFMVVVHSGRF